jgi:hypothetical protein
MATSLPPTARRPRLNPFAFVSDTTFRFVLLIVSVASSSLFLFFGMYATLDITKVQRDRDASRVEQCLIEAEVLLPPGKEPFFIPRTPAEIDAANAYIQAGNRCFHESKRSQALWMLGGLALLFATAGAIYWAYPTLKMRQSRLVRLRREDMPEVVDLKWSRDLGHQLYRF